MSDHNSDHVNGTTPGFSPCTQDLVSCYTNVVLRSLRKRLTMAFSLVMKLLPYINTRAVACRGMKYSGLEGTKDGPRK